MCGISQSVPFTMQARGTAASWSQTTDDVFIRVGVPQATRGRDLKFDLHPKRLNLSLNGSQLLTGSLSDVGEIKADGMFNLAESPVYRM